ncbi:MAG: ROK family protein [Anaerolineae bacterium]
MLLYTTIIKNLQIKPLSLADLNSMTNASLPTLRKAVQELTDHHWIRVVGQAEANGGRPAMLFGFDESYYILLGVHIQLPGLRLMVSDLSGNVLDAQEMFQKEQASPQQIMQAIIDYTQTIQSRFNGRKLLGIGIAAPGFTDPETGNIISIGRVPGWENFPICQRLSSQLHVPAQIANDIDCMAFAEFQHARKSFVDNLVYIGFDEGVKASMFLNGELYKGSFGNAGLIVDRPLNMPDNSLLSQDYHRILTISGFNQIFEEQIKLLPPTDQASYQHIIDMHYRQRMGAIFQSAQTNDPICQNMVHMLNTVLAIAIANIIYVIQPDTLVIGGILSAMSSQQFNTLSASIREQLPVLFANHIQIEQAQLQSRNISALGANYHFIENHLLSETFELLQSL